MTDSTSGTPYYTIGFSESMLQHLRRHTAQTHAAHLLPHLKPGLRVLDLGCGPGTLSVSLAEAVAPGALYGVDMEPTQVDLARSIAEAGGHDNATFQVGDVTELSFDDDSFDVVHGHAILAHVPDTQGVLAEATRVLKPGGLISVREWILENSFLAPDFELIGDAWITLAELITADDGHPNIGRDLKRHLLEAGFTDVRPAASFTSYTTAEDVGYISHVIENWFLSADVRASATTYGVTTQQQLDNLEQALKRWMRHPGAFGAVAYGEVIARKPQR
jgi:ubiquinone/menaquinone biosynthesis C-methylase UbiE